VANQLASDGAVRVLNDGTHDALVFLVMEYLEGETLAARVRRSERGLAAGEVFAIASHLLRTLAAAHLRGIVHRDIKPDNVFVSTDGSVRVLDFGLASVHDSSGTLTASTAMIGTPAFMAPEQARGHARLIGPATDVWGVGATVFFMLSGRYVHDAETSGEMIIAAGTQPAPSLASVTTQLAPALISVVDRALAFDAGRRWENAGAMLAALRGALAAPRPAALTGSEITTTLSESVSPTGNANARRDAASDAVPPPVVRASSGRAAGTNQPLWLVTAAVLAALMVAGWLTRSVRAPHASDAELHGAAVALQPRSVDRAPLGVESTPPAAPTSILTNIESPATSPSAPVIAKRKLPRALPSRPAVELDSDNPLDHRK